MNAPSELEIDFWRVFGRVLGRHLEPGHYTQAQLPEWDSLRHVELMFELEENFRIEVPNEAIATLFSDTDTVVAFLNANAEGSAR